MASRAFSSSSRAAKALKWKFNGTTVPVDSYIAAVERAVDALPTKFSAKAEVGVIQGNPHTTPENNDPEHASGRIGTGNASGKKRLSSFHAYPDGRVTFSDPALAPFSKGPDAVQSAVQSTDNYWTWDDQYQRHYHMHEDGSYECCCSDLDDGVIAELESIEAFNASGRGLNDRIGVIDTRGSGSLESRLSWLKVENFPGVRGDGTLNLHGFDIRQIPDSDVLQIVLINHRPPIDPITGEDLDPKITGANSTIEVFETEVGSGKMMHVKTYAHKAIQTPNRVTWIDGDTFVFTNDHNGKVGFRRALSPYIGGSSLGCCNQTDCQIAVQSRFKLPNGLIVGKDSLLYVPDTSTGEIYIYSFASSPSLLPDLQFNTSIKLSYPLDNLSVDEKGDIFVAAFPMSYKWDETAKDPFGKDLPSTVFRIRKLKEGEYEVEKVLEDDGTVLSGITVAVHDVRTGSIFLGGVVAPFIVICEAI
ncbi:hypothetical protein B7494_g364 [Chlorociboria aeruginascens]|nr:hypothetical protein B7494_g364 [Chlorociboria aeruginascens]